MTGLNHATIMGVLSEPLIERQTKNGKAWVVALLEVEYYRRTSEGEPGQLEKTRIPVNLFAKQAQIAQQSLQPGDPVVVQIRIAGTEYQPQSGPVRRGVTLSVDQLHLIPNGRKQAGKPTAFRKTWSEGGDPHVG